MSTIKVGIIGLGYVGLPLALRVSRVFDTVGYDISVSRVEELQSSFDRTREAVVTDLREFNSRHKFTSDLSELSSCTVYLVTVPTPVDDFNVPDLGPLIMASEAISTILKSGDLVSYESTVYPGVTEEVCAPILEKSGLVLYRDGTALQEPSCATGFFHLGYSPERVNPGDSEHSIDKINKIISASSPYGLDLMQMIYSAVTDAGLHLSPSIRVAEAAKVIENIQRDVNIGLVNELSLIMDRLEIDIHSVLEAARTKWNFLDFRPGLVGGHCIGVDPFYLTHVSERVGFHPEVILSGRRTNDSYHLFWVNKFLKLFLTRQPDAPKNVLVCGYTFKENCPDVRNSRAFEFVRELTTYGFRVDLYDPVADSDNVFTTYGVNPLDKVDGVYSSLILLVPHKRLLENFQELKSKHIVPGGLVFDPKAAL